MDERRVIETLRAAGCSLRVIGLRLAGRQASSISRELRRNGGPAGYTAAVAQRCAANRLKGRWRSRRFADARLAVKVRGRLAENWSPEQIVGRWASALSRVSVPTIYAWLRRERPWWLRHLRQGLARGRRSYRQPSKYTRIRGVTSIDARPEMVAQRLRCGDWESDTVRGCDQVAGLATHVDRRTGYVSCWRACPTGARPATIALRAPPSSATGCQSIR